MDTQKLDLIDQGKPSEGVSLELRDAKSSLPGIFVYSFDSPILIVKEHLWRVAPELALRTESVSHRGFAHCHSTS